MFGNLVNRDDALRLAHAGGRGAARVVQSARAGPQRRVRDKWNAAISGRDKWHDVPMVRRRWATMISGDPEVGFPEYAMRKYLAGRSSLSALALGCGGGMRVLRWAREGLFSRVDGIDLAPARIEQARRAAAKRGLDHIVHFDVGDVFDLDLPDASYDVVIGEQSIHHFAPMDAALGLVRRVLRDDGWFFVDEFVGPSRLQWHDRQVEVASALVAALPNHLRTRLDGRLKVRANRPSRLHMRFTDPSEAVESHRIRPLLHELFEVVDEKDYGGAILHLALNGIGHHFRADDPDASRILEAWFLTEDLLMAAGEIGSDFMVAVCRKRTRSRNDES